MARHAAQLSREVRLADIAAYDPNGELPHKGTLSFFFDYTNWGKPGREAEGSLATVLYLQEGEALKRMVWPEALPMRERYAPLTTTSFRRELTVPDFESPVIEQFGYTLNSLYPPDDMSEHAMTARRIEDVMLSADTYLHETYDSRGLVHRLLGYGDGIQGGVESMWHWLAGTIRESGPVAPEVTIAHKIDWRLLLQVDSDENGMTWGDLGRIYFGLPRQALAARDYSQTIAELQCT
jgi:hypothetical protein